ncbi:MAG: serine hydrolase [Patescibacteria group bacterium]
MIGLIIFFSFPDNTTKINVKEVVAEESKPTYIDPFKDVQLEAKAAYVYDFTTGKALFQKNPDQVLPLASITKVMTAITALESSTDVKNVVVTDQSLSQEGDSGLFGNETWSLTNLLKYTLLVSSNDGAAAVATAFNGSSFIDSMNAKAVSMGLPSLHFNNESGLDVSTTEAGGYGSAKDVAKLMHYAMTKHQDIFEATRYETMSFASEDEFTHKGVNTSPIAEKIPGLVGGKTGYSVLAGGNLAVVVDMGIQHPVAIVVLGSSYEGRFQDVENLVSATIGAISVNEYNAN